MPVTQGKVEKLEVRTSQKGNDYLLIHIRGEAKPFASMNPEEWKGVKEGDVISFIWQTEGDFQNIDSGSRGANLGTPPAPKFQTGFEMAKDRQKAIVMQCMVKAAVPVLVANKKENYPITRDQVLAFAESLYEGGQQKGFW